jgi:hypothetical protein
MTSSLADELNSRAVDVDGVHQALRYYLAERLDDLPPEDMLSRMYEVAGQAAVDRAHADLTRDPKLLESRAGRAVGRVDRGLRTGPDPRSAGREQGQTARDRGRDHRDRVHVRHVPAGHPWHQEVRETTTHNPDGTFVEKEKIEHTDPTRPLGAIPSIFRQNPAVSVSSRVHVKPLRPPA